MRKELFDYACKENDTILRFLENDGKLDEVMVKTEGDTCWTIIGVTDLNKAIKMANKKIKEKEWDCSLCKHSFTNPFDQMYCHKDFDPENDIDCGGKEFKKE